jgi:hypothetical protein
MTNIFLGKVFLCSAIIYLADWPTQGPADHKQGIEGYVYRISGNQMPSPQIKRPLPKGTQATIYIYELTGLNQVDRQGQSPFYFSVKTKLVKKAASDSSGYFKIALPPGHYSLFTKKDTLFYANWFDKDNHISPIEILPGKMTKTEIRIDYDAAY